MTDRLEQPAIVEPIDPPSRGVLDGLEVAPRPAGVGHFLLEQSDHGLRNRVIVRVADAADGRLYWCLSSRDSAMTEWIPSRRTSLAKVAINCAARKNRSRKVESGNAVRHSCCFC